MDLLGDFFKVISCFVITFIVVAFILHTLQSFVLVTTNATVSLTISCPVLLVMIFVLVCVFLVVFVDFSSSGIDMDDMQSMVLFGIIFILTLTCSSFTATEKLQKKPRKGCKA